DHAARGPVQEDRGRRRRRLGGALRRGRMNERRKQDAYKHLAAIRQSLDALGKLGLAGTDDLFERKLRRIVGRAHEAMRELGEFLEEAHPHGAPRPAAPPGADLSARLLSSADLAAYRAL